MAGKERTWTLNDLAQLVGGECDGDGSYELSRPVPAGTNDPLGITFATNEKYLKAALETEIGAVLVPIETPKVNRNVIRVADPRLAFGMVLGAFSKPVPAQPGIHPTAIVSTSAKVSDSASIGAFVIIEENAFVADNAKILPHCYIGENCQVGENTILYPNVVLVQDIRVGKKCTLHSGVVVGTDGFGFNWNGEYQQKVPQVGGVIIGDNVEIGAYTCIDRATCGDTVIADGVKFDNMVQIAHNVKIGAHTVMAAQVGISGSATIGERNVYGGQAAVSHHVSIGDDMVFGGRSGIFGNMDQAGEYFGLPAVPLSQAMRVMALQNRLPELFKRLRSLEQEIAELKNGT
ncbi:MAG: UDP-3-O-(3-hydroxymyristoyl)glucosamine N-acyltransferase [Fimbriimonadaceae bacterium]|nr:UDP-3-O-(3-hydroxymyristoyl)glucosamine N-acyltransferase [Fimbriimonadaceae bacterium]